MHFSHFHLKLAGHTNFNSYSFLEFLDASMGPCVELLIVTFSSRLLCNSNSSSDDLSLQGGDPSKPVVFLAGSRYKTSHPKTGVSKKDLYQKMPSHIVGMSTVDCYWYLCCGERKSRAAINIGLLWALLCTACPLRGAGRCCRSWLSRRGVVGWKWLRSIDPWA